MPKFYRKIQGVGLPPGMLAPVTDDHKTRITLFDYNETTLLEKELNSVEESFDYKDTRTISWINIDGRDLKTIQDINTHFDVHPLVLEDIVNQGQRAKLEDYGSYLFFVLNMIRLDEDNGDIDSEQVGLVLGEHFVLSFQEKEGDVFDPVRKRLRDGKGRIRKMDSDYLAYALIDAIVDHYFIILEQIGGKIDQLEEELLEALEPDMPIRIHQLKSQIIYLRKQIWPLREVLSTFQRLESRLVKKATLVFLQDVYDHAIQVNDTIEALRDTLSGLRDIYLSNTSNRMNEIMKVLTIFAAIFIPLTFMAGIYGMNFEHMPELKWKYGYFFFLGILAIVGLGMLYFFKKRKWL